MSKEITFISQVLRREIIESYRSSQSHTKGKILTIIDATTSDPEQRKATKDLIHDTFATFTNDLYFFDYAINVLAKNLFNLRTESNETVNKKHKELTNSSSFLLSEHLLKDMENAELG